MKDNLQIASKYVERFVLVFIIHISLNWLWGESEDIVFSILHTLTLTGILYAHDYVSRKRE